MIAGQLPWTLSAPAKPTPDAPAGGDIAILDASGNIIAECFVWVNEAQTVDAASHARLMRASPDLLRELQHVVHWFDQLTPEDIARYRIAITKATGVSDES